MNPEAVETQAVPDPVEPFPHRVSVPVDPDCLGGTGDVISHQHEPSGVSQLLRQDIFPDVDSPY